MAGPVEERVRRPAKGPGEALRPEDFSFDPPYGSEGTSIRLLGENRFAVELGTAPGHPEWRNALQCTILRNARGRRLHLEVAFDYDRDKEHRYNNYFVSFSYDGLNWRPVHWTYDRSRDGWNNPHNLIFPRFEADRVHIGIQVPFVIETLESLLEGWRSSDCLRVEVLGHSGQGRPIYRLTIADFRRLCPRPRVHYFKNEHGAEGCARWRMAGLIDWLLLADAEPFRREHLCHLVVLSNPDGPAHGYLRVNADGVDQNRTFRADGPASSEQPVEQRLCQQDVEAMMAGESSLTTFWSFHTWQGPAEVMVRPGSTLPDWQRLRDILLDLDDHGLFEPMHDFRPSFQNGSMWNEGMHDRFGITTFLSEGGATHFTKDQCLRAGRLLGQALSAYYDCAGRGAPH